MKNWGTRILLLYLGFVALIVVLVSMSMRQNTDLVSKDYYAQEIAYQNKLDKMNRTESLSAPVKWNLNHGKLHIEFPDEIHEPVNGTVTLFCSSDAAKDRNIKFETSTKVADIELKDAVAGQYTVQLDWKSGAQTYYQEGAMYLQ